jgi:DNA-binding NtrC family response regulator
MSIDDALQAGWTLEAILQKVRREVIVHVLKQEKQHCERTAARLGIHRNTLLRQMIDLNIPRPGTRGKKQWRRRLM